MFVPVGCAECGKLFQVERGQLGRPASCPWCQARVLALPVAAQPRVGPEPLPLPALSVRGANGEENLRASIRSRARIWPWIVVVFIGVFLAAGTFLVQRYRGGAVPPFVMQTFVAPDRSCQATLPGSVEAVAVAAFTPLQTGASLFAAKSWFTRAHGGLGWVDLDPERIKLVRIDDLLANVRDELGRWLGAPTIDKEGLVKTGSSDGMEVRYGSDGTRFTARLLAVLDSPQPRIYLVWVGGPQFNPDGELATRVLTSFRVTPAGK